MKQSVKLIVGNWKMNGVGADLEDVRRLSAGLRDAPGERRVAICPPATLLARMADMAGPRVEVGAQDCRAETAGAYTGGLSAEMLVDAGATLVIVGHSERRQEFGESNALVAAKAEAALRAGLEPIICVGESLEHREAGEAVAVVTRQLEESMPEALRGRTFSVAYEPVWAVGSGRTPTLAEIGDVHAAIRAALTDRLGDQGVTPLILYGGSVKGSNAAEILSVPDVGGALVGGASLGAEDFLPIIRAL